MDTLTKPALQSTLPSQYKADQPSQQCSICRETLELPRLDGEIEKAYILPCSHIFGDLCIARWLDTSPNHNCPTCRRSMLYQDCGHPIKPCEISKAPTCVNAEDMPEKCVLCRQGGVWEERLVAMRERQLAEERVLEGLKLFLPTAFGGMCRSTVESAGERVEESRETFRMNVDRIRMELEKEGRESW